jgi:hypothetical protein
LSSNKTPNLTSRSGYREPTSPLSQSWRRNSLLRRKWLRG